MSLLITVFEEELRTQIYFLLYSCNIKQNITDQFINVWWNAILANYFFDSLLPSSSLN